MLLGSHVNALFSSLIQHRECCTINNGVYIKSGLDKIEIWCGEATEEVLFWMHTQFRTFQLRTLFRIVYITQINVCCDFSSLLANSYIFLAVCWLVLGWSQTPQASSWIFGMFFTSAAKSFSLCVLLICKFELLFFIFSGLMSTIFSPGYQWEV